jgi:hypothetical protein
MVDEEAACGEERVTGKPPAVLTLSLPDTLYHQRKRGRRENTGKRSEKKVLLKGMRDETRRRSSKQAEYEDA